MSKERYKEMMEAEREETSEGGLTAPSKDRRSVKDRIESQTWDP